MFSSAQDVSDANFTVNITATRPMDGAHVPTYSSRAVCVVQTERTPTSSLDFRNSNEVFIVLDASHIPQPHKIQPSLR